MAPTLSERRSAEKALRRTAKPDAEPYADVMCPSCGAHCGSVDQRSASDAIVKDVLRRIGAHRKAGCPGRRGAA